MTLPAALCTALPSLSMFKVLSFLALLMGLLALVLRHIQVLPNPPIEILAFHLDIGHAITGNALPLAAGRFFLPCSHLDDMLVKCTEMRANGANSGGRCSYFWKVEILKNLEILEMSVQLRSQDEVEAWQHRKRCPQSPGASSRAKARRDSSPHNRCSLFHIASFCNFTTRKWTPFRKASKKRTKLPRNRQWMSPSPYPRE